MKLAVILLIQPTISESVCVCSRIDDAHFSISQDETSELFIGEWMEQRGIRDQIVLATKASSLLVMVWFIILIGVVVYD
jgi:hypothetical protein